MRQRRRPRNGSRWSWLGLGLAGAAGLVAAVALLRPRSPRGVPRRKPNLETTSDAEEMAAELDYAWIAGPGGSLRVAECHPEGGLALVFVHGLAGRLEHWGGQLAALGPDLRGLAFDLPGHGESDPSEGANYGVDALAQAIAAVVDNAGLRRCVVVAHSIGAQAALRYARRHPARVAGLLLADPVGDLTRLSPNDRRALFGPLRRDPADALGDSFRQLLRGAAPSTIDRVLQDFQGCEPAVAAAILEAGATESPVADLDRLVVPVWSVTTPLNRQPNALHKLSPLVNAVDLPSAGHWLMMDEPDGFNRVLDAFLDVVRTNDAN